MRRLPSARFSISRSSWPMKADPTGATSRPPGLSCSISGCGHFLGRRGQHDHVERRVLGPAAIAVAGAHCDVARSRVAAAAPSLRASELRHDLDRVHLARPAPRAPRPGSRSRCRSRARGRRVRRRAAARSSTRRCRAARSSGRGRSAAGGRRRRQRPALGLDEQVARHAAHRIEHAPVVDVAARELPLHHPRALRGAVIAGIGRRLRTGARGHADHRNREQPPGDARVPGAQTIQDFRR